MDIKDIMQMLPHRYPLLLVDKVLESKIGVSIRSLKNVSINEPFFVGHFPGHPVMPGVLIVEAMAQTAGIFVLQTLSPANPEDLLVYFMSIENAKFRKPVRPGDQLIFFVTKIQSRANVWKMKAEATVDDKKVAEAVFTAMIVKRSEV